MHGLLPPSYEMDPSVGRGSFIIDEVRRINWKEINLWQRFKWFGLLNMSLLQDVKGQQMNQRNKRKISSSFPLPPLPPLFLPLCLLLSFLLLQFHKCYIIEDFLASLRHLTLWP